MFGKPPQINLQHINPTSKMALKMSCLTACNNDINQAERLYNFIAGDLGNLPDFDPVKPSIITQITDGANNLFGWIDANSDRLIKGYQLIQSLRGSGIPSVVEATAPPVDVPPIPQP